LIKKDFTWKVGGEAGYGIMVTGDMFSRACMRSGAHTFDYPEYPSLIRGGHNTYQTRVSDQEVYSQVKPVNILVALNQDGFDLHKSELTDDAIVIFDPKNTKVDFENTVALPMDEIVEKFKGDKIMRNTVALGASLAIVCVEFEVLEELIRESFSSKGEDVVKHNVDIAKAGYDFVGKKKCSFKVAGKIGKKRLLISGNDALSLGAIKSGCKFLSTYPMTPATAIMHYFAKHESDMGLIMKHTEDEISGVLMAIGAGHAGVRSMAATSGGGFALMVEALGMAAMSETPVVVTVAQRPGPSTGLPTWTEQADLRFVLHASQGDFFRVVLTPGDHEECFEAGLQAFNYAEKYQTPVIILTDKYLGESFRSVEPFTPPKGWRIDRGKVVYNPSADYKRYEFAKDGISPRAFAGSIIFGAFSNEHNKDGDFTEDPEMRKAMMEKRMKKAETADREIKNKVRYYGDENPDVTIFSWGSTKGPVLEAMKMAKGLKIGFVHTFCVMPFPTKEISEHLQAAKKPVLIEGNISAQFGGLIREYTGFEIKDRLLKYDGRPFYPEDILKFIKNG